MYRLHTNTHENSLETKAIRIECPIRIMMCTNELFMRVSDGCVKVNKIKIHSFITRYCLFHCSTAVDMLVCEYTIQFTK